MNLGICMVAVDFYPRVGGMQTHTLALAQHLQAIGVNVFVVTRSYPGLPLYEEVGGLSIHRVDVRPNASKIEASFRFINGALKLMKERRAHFQIIHSHQVISPTTIGLIGRELMHKKVIVNPHSTTHGGDLGILLRLRPLTGGLRLFWMKKRADAFVAISQDIKDVLIGLGFPPNKIAYISNGVDTTHFSPLSAYSKAACRQSLNLSDGPIIVFVGRLVAVKQLDVLIKAFAGLVPNLPASAQLLIVGDGEERARLENQAVELGVSPQVRFIGSVANVRPYLQASDIFVLPSRNEGLPVALLEAMACSLPCVASATGGILDVIRPGINGLMAPPGDVQALQSGLNILLSDSMLAAQLGRQARQDAHQNYSMEHTARDYVRLYRGLLTPATS
jgi:N-acetyl-alpha-D-glucosaminyl L-malate synthase BshA